MWIKLPLSRNFEPLPDSNNNWTKVIFFLKITLYHNLKKDSCDFQASSTLRRRNLKTEFSFWKRIKCFPFTLRRRNLKTEFSLWKRVTEMYPVRTSPEEFEKATIVAHFGFVFEETLDREIINHMIIVTSSFSKNSVFKMFSVHTKTKSRRFQIPPVWSATQTKFSYSLLLAQFVVSNVLKIMVNFISVKS